MKLFFRNLSYFKQIVILLAVCATFSIYLGYQDSKNQVIITGVILPIFIAMFSALLNKIVESNKMYVDLKLYNYNQIKKLIDIEKHQKHLFKVFYFFLCLSGCHFFVYCHICSAFACAGSVFRISFWSAWNNTSMITFYSQNNNQIFRLISSHNDKKDAA